MRILQRPLDPAREFRAGQEKEVLYVLFPVNDRGAVSEAGFVQEDSAPVEAALQRRLAPFHRPVVVPGKERLEDG